MARPVRHRVAAAVPQHDQERTASANLAGAAETPVPLRVRALRLLSRRDYSRHELAAKLQGAETDAAVVSALLDELESCGWLSELRVAQHSIRRAAGRYGSRKVLDELERKGLQPEVLAQAREQLREAELESARSALQKRFGAHTADLQQRQRQARFLAQRGFDLEVIHHLLGGVLEE